MPAADRVLLLRSGRHVETAVDQLRRRFPRASIEVLSRTGPDEILASAGLAERDCRPYTRSRFTPVGVLALALRRLLRSEPAARVAVLWGSPDGRGFDNVTCAALMLAPRGILAITPDGAVREVSGWRVVRDRCRDALQQTRERCSAAIWRWVWRLEGPELEPRLWHSHYLGLRALARDLPPVARELEGTIVDIGAGTGLARRWLDPTRTRYVATDLPTGRDASDPTISGAGTRPHVHCNGYALPFPDGSVDGVVSSAVLEHVTDPRLMLREAARILKPGGRLLAYVPFVFPVHGAPADYRRWTARGLERDVVDAGLALHRTALVGGSLASIVMNALVVLRIEVAGRSMGWTRLALGLAWPIVLLLQALANLLASSSSPGEHTAFPMSVVVVAEKPVAR